MTDTAPAKVGATPVARTEDDEQSIGQLVASASRDVSALIRYEIALAKSEVKVSVKAGGLGAALFAAAGFVLLLGVVLFSFFLVYLVNLTGLDLAWCYLLIFLLYLAVAGVLGFVGYKKVRSVRPPERAIAQAQETKNALINRG